MKEGQNLLVRLCVSLRSRECRHLGELFPSLAGASARCAGALALHSKPSTRFVIDGSRVGNEVLYQEAIAFGFLEKGTGGVIHKFKVTIPRESLIAANQRHSSNKKLYSEHIAQRNHISIRATHSIKTPHRKRTLRCKPSLFRQEIRETYRRVAHLSC